MEFLGWFDDSKKRTEHKVLEAIAAYQERFKAAPNVVLVNQAELVEVEGVTVRSESYIRRNNYWVGWEGAPAPGRA